MEIESRYLVPDVGRFRSIQSLTNIGRYHLITRPTKCLHDTYLDTLDRDLTRAGWSCRIRQIADKRFITVKSPADATSKFSAREEWEFPVPSKAIAPQDWGNPDVAAMVESLTHKQELAPLLDIKQKRRYALVLDGIRRVAEMSFDTVVTNGRHLHNKIHFIECELLPDGNPDDLDAIDQVLVQQYAVKPHPASKLRHGLDLLAAIELLEGPDGPARISIEETARQVGVAELLEVSITSLMQQLYNGLQPLHALPPWHRSLANAAALLYCAGECIDYKRPWKPAYRLASQRRFAILSETDQTMLASIMMLTGRRIDHGHVSKALPKKLSDQNRLESLLIASLLRIALPIAKLGDKMPAIERVSHTRDSRPVEIYLSGPGAIEAVRKARKKSDLWSEVTNLDLHWKILRDANLRSLGLSPEDTFATTACHILGFYREVMVANEPGTREGTNPESLHDMRVATRRMRSFLQLFGGIIDCPETVRTSAALYNTARVLGDVRDLDVALERLLRHTAQDSTEAQDLATLLSNLYTARQQARERLLAHLDSPAFAETLEAIDSLLAALNKTAELEGPTGLQMVTPFIYIHYGTVQRYSEVLDNATIPLLHALRIDCKKLRYALEFYQEILPAKVAAAIPRLTTLQDHLGEMHDASVSIALVDAFVQEQDIDQENQPAVWRACSTFRKICRDEVSQRVKTFPSLWKQFDTPAMRKAFEKLRQESEIE